MSNEQNAPEGTHSAEMGFEEPTAWKEHKRAEDRLWLAGTIAAGMVANNHNWFAEDAVYMADKLLEALEKEKSK